MSFIATNLSSLTVVAHSRLTLSQRLDVPNVPFLPVTGANLTLRMSSPQRQVGKDQHEGVYIIMRAGMKGLKPT